MKDPIVEEVRKARWTHAAKFNFDIHAICADLKKKQKSSGHPLVSFSSTSSSKSKNQSSS